jgi:serine phosphatase RsbU (regulator of sigma subunit)
LNKILGDHLLFFQPKDIVSGDFYYVEEINGKKYIGVIDCTGHGVPGGFMSMLAYNALIKTLHDDKLQKPGEILNALSKIVIEHFSQEGKHTMRDGMDMALVVLTPQEGYYNMEYAGAQNPCWIIKATDNALIELKPDKQSIGYVEDFVPYKTQSVQVDYNDTIYLFSDGYADQFGGPNGKKFKYSQMKSLMQIEPQLSLKNRTELLKTSFYEWMEHYDQIDDVCVLGVRVK